MGWEDAHLHEFCIQHPLADQVVRIGVPTAQLFEDEKPCLSGRKELVSTYFERSMTAMPVRYVYDLGDDWQHVVTLEDIWPAEDDLVYPRCVAGERACPPEDCGGMRGYQEFREAILDPTHAEHRSIIEWCGGKFEPDYFNPKSVSFADPDARWKSTFGRSSRL